MSQPYQPQDVAEVTCRYIAEAVRQAGLATGERLDYAAALAMTPEGPGVLWVVLMPSHLIGQKIQNFGVVGLDTPAEQIEAGILAAVHSMQTVVAEQKSASNGTLGRPLHL